MILNINKYLLICKCAINKRAATNKAWDVRGPASLSQHQNKPGIIVKLRVSSLLIFLDIQILTLLQKVTLSKTYVHIIVQFAKNGEFIKISYIIWLLERKNCMSRTDSCEVFKPQNGPKNFVFG